MRIFILDDEYERRKSILAKDITSLGQDVLVTACMTFEEGIATLSDKSDFDVFMLDHDLAYEDDSKDGAAIAQHIVENKIGIDKLFIIHSTNFYGAKNMAHVLNQDGRIILIAPVNLMRTMPLTYADLIRKHI